MKYNFIQQFLWTEHNLCGKSLITEVVVRTRDYDNEHHDPMATSETQSLPSGRSLSPWLVSPL